MRIIQVPHDELPEGHLWVVMKIDSEIVALVSAAAMVTHSAEILTECEHAAIELLAEDD